MSTIRQRENSWQAIVRIKSKGILTHQESKSFPTRALAKSWADGVETRIHRVGPTARQVEQATLGGIITRYMEQLAGLKPLRRSLEHELSFLAERFQSTKLSQLTSELFVTFANARHREGAGPATVLHNLTHVRTVLNATKPMFNLDVDGTTVSDALKVLKRLGLAAPSKKRTQRVTDAILDTLVREFERIAPYPQTKIPMATIVKLAVEFPRRRTELCSMLWTNYRPKQGEMTLMDTKHPTEERNEVVPVPPSAADIFSSLPVIDARLLPYDPESVSAAFERACARLGIVDVRFHDLRHEGISRLFEQGLAIQEVALISGHTSWATLRRYTHLKPVDVVEKLRAYRKETQKTGPAPT